ncbi:MAG TPA: LysM domain-containing protein [Candidatus Limnocylindrales bacterium]|nr:LysM domain-containing protein [Candidatus Limnocylindrales bacterium]
MANERRRRRTPTADAGRDAATLAGAAALGAAVDGPADVTPPGEEPTKVFHVPGMAAAAAAATVAGAASGGVEAAAGAIGHDAEGARASTPVAAAAAGASLADRDAEPVVEELPPTADDRTAANDITAAEVTTAADGFEPGPTSAATPSWLAVLDDRSPDPEVCPFLRATSVGGLTSPFEQPDPANRCAALAEAVPQSLRQQELVCLTTGHVNCPRYLRGAAVMTETPKPVVRERQPMSVPMLASLVVLVVAIASSVGFVLARGGALSIGPGASPGASEPVAVVSPSPASIAPSISPSLIAEVTPTPDPTPSPTPTPTPSPSPTPKPSPTPRPTPSSDRYQLLTACANTPRCWIYTVRRGDNVFSIAHYFGVSTDAVYSRNPWLRNTGLRAGQQLRLPPPTR